MKSPCLEQYEMGFISLERKPALCKGCWVLKILCLGQCCGGMKSLQSPLEWGGGGVLVCIFF